MPAIHRVSETVGSTASYSGNSSIAPAPACMGHELSHGRPDHTRTFRFCRRSSTPTSTRNPVRVTSYPISTRQILVATIVGLD